MAVFSGRDEWKCDIDDDELEVQAPRLIDIDPDLHTVRQLSHDQICALLRGSDRRRGD